MRRIIVAAALLLTLTGPAWAKVYDGSGAQNRTASAAALREVRLLAEQGDAGAQYGLGTIYRRGLGVRQDYAEAARWYRKSAEQGHFTAQYNLGSMYGNGHGVPRDLIRAHKWFNLASSRAESDEGRKKAMRYRDMAAGHMTRAQIAEAHRMALEWRRKQDVSTSTPSAADSGSTRQHITRVQRRLVSLGYNPGPVDGILGPRTRSAIRAFEARERLPVTGALSEMLEAALLSASPAGSAACNNGGQC